MMKKILSSKTGDTCFIRSGNTYYDNEGRPAFTREAENIRDANGNPHAYISYDNKVTSFDGRPLGEIDVYGRFVNTEGDPLLE